MGSGFTSGDGRYRLRLAEYAAHDILERGKVGRFLVEFRGAMLKYFCTDHIIEVRRKYIDGYVLEFLALPDLFQHVQSARERHIQVRDDEVRQLPVLTCILLYQVIQQLH